MSLKAFHVFFVSVSTIFALGFGVWCFAHGDVAYVVTGVASIIGGCGLLYYGRYFMRKSKDIGYL